MGVGSLTICNRVKCFGTPNKYSLWHNGITFVICLLECSYWRVALRYSWHKYTKDSPFKIWGHTCRDWGAIFRHWRGTNGSTLELYRVTESFSVMFPSCSLPQRECMTQNRRQPPKMPLQKGSPNSLLHKNPPHPERKPLIKFPRKIMILVFGPNIMQHRNILILSCKHCWAKLLNSESV